MAHRHLLVLRFALVNMVAAGLTAAAYLQGWLDGLFTESTVILSAIVFAVFLYGLALCAVRIWRTSADLAAIGGGSPPAGSRADGYLKALGKARGESLQVRISMLRLRLSHQTAIVCHMANSLVFLGLIGTVIGFIIALSGVDPSSVTDADNVAPMVATLIRGMSVALYTTLLGAVLSVWLTINHRLLASGAVDLMSAIVERGAGR